MQEFWKHFVASILEHTKAEFPHFRDALFDVCEKARGMDLIPGSTHDVFTLTPRGMDGEMFFFLAALPTGVELGTEKRSCNKEQNVVEILRHSYCGPYTSLQHRVEQLLLDLSRT